MKRTLLQIVFLILAVLAAADLILIRGLFTWMILAPLVLITGLANTALCLWNREGRKSLLFLAVTVIVCGAYAALLAWSLT